jgi:hypothetical protein
LLNIDISIYINNTDIVTISQYILYENNFVNLLSIYIDSDFEYKNKKNKYFDKYSILICINKYYRLKYKVIKKIYKIFHYLLINKS